MAKLDTTKELDFLIHETGQDSSHLLAQAMQEGIHILFKRNSVHLINFLWYPV